jgi:hypothetical protein
MVRTGSRRHQDQQEGSPSTSALRLIGAETISTRSCCAKTLSQEGCTAVKFVSEVWHPNHLKTLTTHDIRLKGPVGAS